MRLGDTRRVWRGRPFHIDRGVRRLRSMDFTEYVLSNPVMASRLREALAESLARERYLFPPGHPNAEAAIDGEE